MIKLPYRHLLVGLGNPGNKYRSTRHNIGFMVVEEFAKRRAVQFKESKFDALIASCTLRSREVELMLPQTFMNESGMAVAGYMNYYKLRAEQLIVVVDDIAIPFGMLRIKEQGTSGGHNGLKSIQNHLNTTRYLRLKLGIGESGALALHDHVLSEFSKEEKEELPSVISSGADCLERLVLEDSHKVASDINRKVKITGDLE